MDKTDVTDVWRESESHVPAAMETILKDSIVQAWGSFPDAIGGHSQDYARAVVYIPSFLSPSLVISLNPYS